MREPHTNVSISLPVSVLLMVQEFGEKEGTKSMSESFTILVRKGLTQVRVEAEKYAVLYPTIEQDESMR